MLDLTNTKVTTYGPFPEGRYHMSCLSAEVKNTKANDGRYISAQFQVADGAHKGRRVYQNFNVENKNPKAVEIAYQDLKKFLVSAGVDQSQMRFKSAEELCAFMCGRIGLAQVVVDGDKNEIKYWVIEKDSSATQTTESATPGSANKKAPSPF